MAKKRIEELGLDPVLLERDRQRGIELARKLKQKQKLLREKEQKNESSAKAHSGA